MTKDFPYNELQEKWLNELWTTRKPQTTEGFLRVEFLNELSDRSGFCCLGLAAEIIDPNPEIESRYGQRIWNWEGLQAILPKEMWEALQLRGADGALKEHLESSDGVTYGSLVEMNDSGNWSFKRIAEWIRENPEQVFTNVD